MIEKLPIGITAAICIMALFTGCADDTVAPADQSPLEKLAGSWEVFSMAADTLVYSLPDDNIHWYFSETGEFCTMWSTAYGSYYPGNSGQVSADALILTEEYETFQATWSLSLSSGADSLNAFIMEPDSMDIDSWYLVRVDDAPEATCGSEE